MIITCLVENTTSNEKIIAEHGLSLFIETHNKKILFDMGQTDAFAINASQLGINIADADIAVLSHGHYDHGGGLKKFFEINKKAPVYLSNYAFEPHYNGLEKYIGLDASLSTDDRIIYTSDFLKISDNLTLQSCNNKEIVEKTDSGGLNKKTNGKLLPDDFLHEQYLLIEEDGKRILFSGCSHKGILNIAEWFKPDVLIGGFHFSKFALDNNLSQMTDKLNLYNTVFYTCHCTGIDQYNFMKKTINNLNYLSAGKNIVL